jgi:TolB protein
LDNGAHLFTIRPDGLGMAERAGGDGVSDGRATWSPDHRRVLFAGHSEGKGSFVVMDADGGNAQPLFTPAFDSLAVGNPAWSPDGRRIAFIGYASETYKNDLYVVGVDGRGLINLTAGLPDYKDWPTWSPDGRQIAFSLWRAGGGKQTQDLAVINSDGSGLKYLTGPEGDEYAPDWSPDGKTLVFVRKLRSRRGLFTMPAGGGPMTLLLWDGDHPVWSPDGRFIAFDFDGLFRVGADGREVVALYPFAGPGLPNW